MTIQSIRKKSIRGKPPEVDDNREYREVWPELRLNMRKQMSTGTGAITIAIVDSGDPGSNAEDRDDDGHATLIDRMIRGRAKRLGLNITIRHFKAFRAQGWPGPKRCAEAIGQAAETNPDVIVLAWDVGHTTAELGDAIFAVRDTAVVVIAAGNWSLDNDRHPNWPANHSGETRMDHVITVMATDEEDERASFSSYGSRVVNIAAPGFAKVDVPTSPSSSTLRKIGSLRDSYSNFRGTSAATAHVALLAALVRAKDQTLKPSAVKKRICSKFRHEPGSLKKRTPIGRLKSLCATEAVADFDEALK